MLEKIQEDKLRRLAKLKDAGIDPFPSRNKKYTEIAKALKEFSRFSKSGASLYVVGRIMSLRDQGGVIFADIYDGTANLQVFASKKESKKFVFWKGVLDIGDFIGVRGTLFKTKRGEKSIRAKDLDMLTKSIRPLPDTWYGLKDVEERSRRRYLDTVFNRDVKDVFVKRSELIRKMREFLWKEGFIEVETPMFHPIPGGALAKPFKTHHNALGEDFYLRIAPELYLKRLLVGGFNKIFEIGRVFRNEGIDRDHNPEFTMLELYCTYQDYDGMIKFTERLLKPFISSKWRKISYGDAFKKYAGIDIDKLKSKEDIDDVFKRKVRVKIKEPTIIFDYPKIISPLAKSKSGDPNTTERFQFIVDSMEVANGFSELNDPLDQRERMEYQEKLFRKGNEEVSRLDEDFLEALEYGMPPAAGLGVGIDRIVALALGKDSLKESIIFPTLKTKK